MKSAATLASFSILFFSLLGTGVVWAGCDSFNCSATIWKASLASGLALSLVAWCVYLPFRNTDRLLGNGLLSMFFFLSLFWLFGFAGFFFYFLFAPISAIVRAVALSSMTIALVYRTCLIYFDIIEAFRKHANLFSRMYGDAGSTFAFTRGAIGLLEEKRRNRNPFKSMHAYAAMLVAPFVLVLNRVLTPTLGDGHGVFLVVAFFAVPILLWGVEIFVQTVMTMIYYPIKLQRETGKPVVMKDW
ncbi:MAG: hypothetical protein ACXWC4_03800 [Telluria sp.]